MTVNGCTPFFELAMRGLKRKIDTSADLLNGFLDNMDFVRLLAVTRLEVRVKFPNSQPSYLR